MTEQTAKLMVSLPHFAELFKMADPRGSAKWEVVRWNDIDPAVVGPEQVTRAGDDAGAPVELSQKFDYRTEALRASADWVRSKVRGYSEFGHWGVWTWRENGSRKYQSVMPALVARRQNVAAAAQTGPSHDDRMVVLSAESYDLLKKLADEDGTTVQAALEAAINEFDRQRYFAKADAAYRKLRNNPEAWEEELRERAELDGTLLDNVDTSDVNASASVLHPEPRERQHA